MIKLIKKVVVLLSPICHEAENMRHNSAGNAINTDRIYFLLCIHKSSHHRYLCKSLSAISSACLPEHGDSRVVVLSTGDQTRPATGPHVPNGICLIRLPPKNRPIVVDVQPEHGAVLGYRSRDAMVEFILSVMRPPLAAVSVPLVLLGGVSCYQM